MSENRNIVGKGMFFMFVGAIIGIFAFIPLLGWLIGLAGAAVSLYGLILASKGHDSFQIALYCTIANMVVGVIANFVSSGGFLSGILSIAAIILSLMITYFVCSSASQLLRGLDDRQAARGTMIWKLYAICALIGVICILLLWLIPIFAETIMVLVAIAQIVAEILYLIFLYQAQKVLQAA